LSDAAAWKLKYDKDPEFHAYEVMRRQLKKHLYKDGIGDLMRQQLNTQGRSNIVEKLLGYTIHDLRVHLERQFTKGMNWDKFMKGEIHIDHIHPKASFDLLDSDEWRVCWSLPNLRPLWAKDNQKKHAKVLSRVIGRNHGCSSKAFAAASASASRSSASFQYSENSPTYKS